MKVLIASFSSESNEHSRQTMGFDNFIFKFGEASIDRLQVKDIFDDAGIEMIPSIAAIGHPGGLVSKDAFDFIYSRMMHDVKMHADEIDGIYLYLHGASKVIDLEGGSAEHAFLKGIRKIVGKYMPIAVVMDPHGNLSQEFVDQTTILRCYRESPHTDAIDTYRKVAQMFVELLQHKESITPVYRKVPIIMGGERSVSTDEPMLSINAFLDACEQDERIMSVSYHIGYLRHDGDKLGNSVVVVPSSVAYTDYANEVADKIYDYAFAKRHEFHYHGVVGEPEEAFQKIMEFDGSPLFITDSGDNCGAGADGYNTYILRQFYNLDDYRGKRILVAGILDHNAYAYLYDKEVGEAVEFDFGMDLDDMCKAVHIKGVVEAKGLVHKRYEGREDVGTAITVRFDDKPMSLVVVGESVSYTDLEQFESSHINYKDYDVFVVKQGYISPDFKAMSPFTIMSLTDGPTNQKTEKLVFKKIMRPMFPFDEI